MQRQFDDPVLQLPRERLSVKLFASNRIALRQRPRRPASLWYISSISLFMRAEIRSRFNFPFAVSIPLSMENGSARRQNARTCL